MLFPWAAKIYYECYKNKENKETNKENKEKILEDKSTISNIYYFLGGEDQIITHIMKKSLKV